MAFVGMRTDRGRVKSVDQDACCYLEADTPVGRVIMAVVCDGVGGLSKGELASTTVIQRFAQWFAESLPTFIGFNGSDPHIFNSIRNVWDTLLQAASEDIHEYGERKGVTLGTTFTGMIVVGGKYLIAHVGDCRAYEIMEGAIRQLTHDQTLVAQQVEAGIITPEEAVNHPKRNVILQSVGTHESVDPEFVTGDLSSQATYLLCCDGFYNKLTAEELGNGFTPAAFATEEDLGRACASHVDSVLERGEKDNITVLAFTEAFGSSETGALPYATQPTIRSTAEMPPVSAAPATTSSPAAASAPQDDEEESATVIVGEEDSPTVVVQGGDA